MASLAFTSLAPPAHEDNMEMSSPSANNLYDEDLDLDIQYADNQTDDERMLEDGEPLRPGTATDEEMGDDDPTLTAQVTEEEMQDGPDDFVIATDDQPDEDLIDYDEDFADDAQINANTVSTQNAEPVLETSAAAETVDEEIVRQPDTVAVEEPAAEEVAQETVGSDVLEQPATEVQELVESESQHATGNLEPDAPAPNTADVKAGTTQDETQLQALAADEAGVHDDEAFAEEQVEDHTTDRRPPPLMPGALDTSTSHIPEGPPTPTDTGLHPMTVKFLDYEMPLFKSHRQLDGLLKDDNLASVSLADLLQHCRQRLLIKIGEDCVTTQQDLVLHFEQLHLFINEVCHISKRRRTRTNVLQNSHCASSTSLNDVLEVFQKFHENADADVPPLSLLVQAQPNFTNSMNALKQAAAAGRSLSQVFPPSLADEATNEHETYGDEYEEEYEENEEHTNGENQHYEYPEEQFEAQDFAGEEYQVEEYATVNPEDYGEEPAYQEGAEHETHGEDSEAYDGLGPIPDPEEDEQEYDETATGPEDESTSLEQQHQAQEPSEPGHADAELSAESTNEEYRDAGQLESTAITGAAADTSANGKTGEYHNDDLIDWDDDESLTEGSSETLEDEGNDEIADLLEVGDDEGDTETVQHSQAKPEFAPEASQDQGEANEANEAHEAHEAHDDELGLNFDSEDFLNEDYPELPAEDGNGETGDHSTHAKENGDGQADIVDFDAGEDSEQYHTAHDLLDGEDDEHTFDETTHDGQPSAEQPYDEDDIGYEDEDDLEAKPVSPAAGVSNSPLGKRSFEEHAEDELDFDEPDSKKARSEQAH